MLKVILYSTISFFLLSLNVAYADEGDVERLSVPEYQDTPSTDDTEAMSENVDAAPVDMTGDLNEPHMPREMMAEEVPNQDMQEGEEGVQQGAPNEKESNTLNNEEGVAQTPEQNQEEQAPIQGETSEQENVQAPETLSAEEAEAKHAEEVELREVGAGEEEGM